MIPVNVFSCYLALARDGSASSWRQAIPTIVQSYINSTIGIPGSFTLVSKVAENSGNEIKSVIVKMYCRKFGMQKT